MARARSMLRCCYVSHLRLILSSTNSFCPFNRRTVSVSAASMASSRGPLSILRDLNRPLLRLPRRPQLQLQLQSLQPLQPLQPVVVVVMAPLWSVLYRPRLVPPLQLQLQLQLQPVVVVVIAVVVVVVMVAACSPRLIVVQDRKDRSQHRRRPRRTRRGRQREKGRPRRSLWKTLAEPPQMERPSPLPWLSLLPSPPKVEHPPLP